VRQVLHSSPSLLWRRFVHIEGTPCDEHPKKMTVAQAVNPSTDVPSEVRVILRQHSTLEISPLLTNIHR
jgi:hypothetical protein